MRLASRESEAPEINLTPLIDVVLLMLVFFIMTTSFSDREALEVNLPSAQTAERVDPAPLAIVIHADGTVRIDGQTVAGGVSGIATALAAARRERPAQADQVRIRADHRVAHGRVITVMDEARRRGFTRVGLATTGGERTP